jgi:hypothetical protein
VHASRYFKASEFSDQPMVLQIETARLEPFEQNGKTVEKVVVYFRGQKSGLVIGPTVWDQIADVAVAAGIDKFDSDDISKWPNLWTELFKDRTPFQGRMTDCIRVRKPATLPPKAKKKPRPGRSDSDDSIQS